MRKEVRCKRTQGEIRILVPQPEINEGLAPEGVGSRCFRKGL